VLTCLPHFLLYSKDQVCFLIYQDLPMLNDFVQLFIDFSHLLSNLTLYLRLYFIVIPK
jgi:hypothetical protein